MDFSGTFATICTQCRMHRITDPALRVWRPRLRKSAHRRGTGHGLYSARGLRLGPAVLFAPLLGLRFFSSLAGANRAEPSGSSRYLRGDAHRRGEITLLPIASCHAAGKNGGGDFAADRVDAGPGGATCTDGDFGGAAE